MKTRSAIIISLSLMLIALVAALPLQAQSSDKPEDFKYDGMSSSGNLNFSWKTADDEVNAAALQFVGGDITSVWLSVWINNHWFDDGRSNITTAPLTSSPSDLSGNTLKFQVRAWICTSYDDNGDCDERQKTDWATLEVEFD